MNNTTVGNKTEKSVASIFRKEGYWVYNCPKSSTGAQPVDIIAIKGGEKYLVWLVDGKHVRETVPSFPLARIEPNQWASMMYAYNFSHIENIGFVIEFERTGEYYWLPYTKALQLDQTGVKSVNLNDLEPFEGVLKNDK